MKRNGLGKEIYDTLHPLKALNNLAAIEGDGIYFLKDLYRYLQEVEVVRKLRDIARPFSKARRAVLLSAPQIELPPELEKLSALARLELPTVEELALLAKKVIGDLSREHISENAPRPPCPLCPLWLKAFLTTKDRADTAAHSAG